MGRGGRTSEHLAFSGAPGLSDCGAGWGCHLLGSELGWWSTRKGSVARQDEPKLGTV